MQTRGWRCHGASLPGINSLVAFAVHRLVRAFDVGRQRNVSQPVKRFAKPVPRSEAQNPQPEISARFHVRLKLSLRRR